MDYAGESDDDGYTWVMEVGRSVAHMELDQILGADVLHQVMPGGRKRTRRQMFGGKTPQQIMAEKGRRAAAFLIPPPNGYYVNLPPRCNPIAANGTNCTSRFPKQVLLCWDAFVCLAELQEKDLRWMTPRGGICVRRHHDNSPGGDNKYLACISLLPRKYCKTVCSLAAGIGLRRWNEPD